MELPSYFSDFLQNIRPTAQDREAFSTAHNHLRQLLIQDAQLGPVIVTTFLQGSHRRATALRANQGYKADVDVVVVTQLSSAQYTPTQALNCFKPFLRSHYPNCWRTNERSLTITTHGVDLDLVVTSAPSHATVGILSGQDSGDETAEESRGSSSSDEALWRSEPLLIPDRQVEAWQPTHPLAQLAWTRIKNHNTHGCFVNIVKAVKWLRRSLDSMPKHPRSYPLERLVGECCPDGVRDVATGLAETLESMVAQYGTYASREEVPFIANHGIPHQNVLARVPAADFRAFMERMSGAARLARRALDCADAAESARLWRELFGDVFPAGDSSGGGGGRGGFSPRTGASVNGGSRFGR